MSCFLLISTCLILYYLMTPILCLFKQCNHNVDMKAGEKLYLNSPYYPNEYPVGSSCRYVIKAPQDYELKFSCTIKLNTPYTDTKCLNEVFYFNREGNELVTDSEYFCGTGKMERKSFLNHAVISYVSTPFYKRIITSDLKESEEEAEILEAIAMTETNITTTTWKPLKMNQLTTPETTTVTATTTTATSQIPIKPDIIETSITHSSLSFSSAASPTPAIDADDQFKDKNFTNSFAYVVALLLNNIDKKTFARKITTTATKSPRMSTILRPTSVLTFYDFLPINTWHNGSISKHKIDSNCVSKVVVGQATILPLLLSSSSTSLSSSLSASSSSSSLSSLPTLSTHHTRITKGGGSFSCLVEVIESQCACGWSSMVKILGASGVAGIDEFPSMAGVMTIKNQKIFCGATIIHHHYLLSAAHCYITPETNRPEYLRVVVGEQDLSTVLESIYTRHYDLVSIIIHEQFYISSTEVHNDIALLKTHLSMEWNRSVGPACLPFFNEVNNEVPIPNAGQRVETAGWGTTSFGGQQSSVLLKTTLDVISQEECQNIIGNLPFGAFCTYTPGTDTCQYDSGGALYTRGERMYAVGIVSYGFACATNQPSVNTRISLHLKWIKNKTPDAQYCVD